METERELLEQCSMRVLKMVARRYLPKPVLDGPQKERRKLRDHYYGFLRFAKKSELVSALLPYMNSNAPRVLGEIANWVKLHPTRRKATRDWMNRHSEEVARIKEAML